MKKMTKGQLVDLLEFIESCPVRSIKKEIKAKVLKEVKKLSEYEQVKFWSNYYFQLGCDTYSSVQRGLRKTGLKASEEMTDKYYKRIFS